MTCPTCHSPASGVTDTRHNTHNVRRRRLCHVCGHRWTTYEIIATPGEIEKVVEMLLEMRQRCDDEELIGLS